MKAVLSLLITVMFASMTLCAQTQPKAGGAVPAGFEGSAYNKARELPARIIDFTAEPTSIQPGQSFSLIWHTENPAGITIDPEPGRVMPRGSRQMTASATTTYTLTVPGPKSTGSFWQRMTRERRLIACP